MVVNRCFNIIKMKHNINMATPIKAGTTIHSEKPFAFILSSKERTFRCDYCFNKTKVLKCSGCQYIYYCGKICQTEAWPEHKKECAGFRKVLPRVVPDAARLLGKLIRRLANGGALQRGYYGEKNFRTWKDLMSHYQDIKSDNRRMEHFTCLCAILFEMIADITLPNSAELLGIYGRMCINGFTILDAEMLSIGTGIYLGASVIDHSCEPNAVAVFDGTTINIQTLVDMPSLDWSKVFISYIDLLNTPFDRQTELLTTYYFLCQCERCVGCCQLFYIHAAQCVKKSCNYPLQLQWCDNLKHRVGTDSNSDKFEVNLPCKLHSNNNSDDLSFISENMRYLDKCELNTDMYKCPKCDNVIEESFKKHFKDVMEFSNTHLQNMKDKSITFVDVCRTCLEKQKGYLHPLSLFYVQTLDFAMDACIQHQFWEHALNYAKLLVPGFKYYYGEKHPSYGLLHFKIGKLQMFLNEPIDALKSLQNAEKILKITHGSKNTLIKDVLNPLMKQAETEIALA